MSVVRSEQCRSTWRRPQALLAFIIGLAACGQERPVQPMAPLSYQSEDTAAVLGAVASTINAINARGTIARKSPDYPANCRQPGISCWTIDTANWQVSTGDRATTMLAEFLGVSLMTRSGSDFALARPWPRPAREGGFRTAVSVRFLSPEIAEVALSQRCQESTGRRMRFLQEESFAVRRAAGAWSAKLTSVGVTELSRVGRLEPRQQTSLLASRFKGATRITRIHRIERIVPSAANTPRAGTKHCFLLL